jgi:hypothetical protein
MASGRASWPDSCGTALSEYESMLNSDSSTASSDSQIVRFSYPAVWARTSVLLIATATVKEQLMKPVLETRTSQGASDVEKYNWLQGTSRGNPLPMARNILTTLKLSEAVH